MILITGATGFLGAHLLYDLIAQGENVRALYRTEESKNAVKELFEHKATGNVFAEADTPFSRINWFQADILDIPALTEAFDEVTEVYHCAAMVLFNGAHFKKMQKVNVEGTANMVNLSLSLGVKKFCHVSSVAALGKTGGVSPITEETHWTPSKEKSVYSITKFVSEMEVWRGTQEGLDVVIVNPSIIIGEGLNNAGSKRFFREIDRGMNYSVPGTNAFVDVIDVTRAMILLMKSKVVNERFILAGENSSFDAFFAIIAQNLHVDPPSKIAKPWQLKLAWRLDYTAHLLFGKKRKLFRTTADAAMGTTSYDDSKFRDRFGFKFTSLEKTIARTTAHYLK